MPAESDKIMGDKIIRTYADLHDFVPHDFDTPG